MEGQWAECCGSGWRFCVVTGVGEGCERVKETYLTPTAGACSSMPCLGVVRRRRVLDGLHGEARKVKFGFTLHRLVEDF